MAKIALLQPHEHFNGTRRLLQELKECLNCDAMDDFRLAVAFAKSSPLVKLSKKLEDWNDAGKTSQAIIGLSHRGTSQQALQIALELFDEVYVCLPGSVSSFHPKIYLFSGEGSGVAFYGSHNLTGGGTETNFEAGIRLDLTLPKDDDLLQSAHGALDALLPDQFKGTKKLDAALLAKLIEKNLVFDETAPSTRFKKGTAPFAGGLFPSTFPAPSVHVPKSTIEKGKVPAAKLPGATSAPVLVSESFLIQITPHHNGEVFLSKKAVKQNPSFFGFPFKGATTPKKGGNTSYPQRVPDPVVHIAIYNGAGKKVLEYPGYGLNTVYYDLKAEIRVTITSSIVELIEPLSMLHMRLGDESCDYYFDIFNPGSKRYKELLAACDQTLPSGGSPISRKMGWI